MGDNDDGAVQSSDSPPPTPSGDPPSSERARSDLATDPGYKRNSSSPAGDDAISEANPVMPPADPSKSGADPAPVEDGGGEPSEESPSVDSDSSDAPASRLEDSAEGENSTSFGPPIAIQVIRGPDRGVRMPLRGGRMIVGRGSGCDLKLRDTSVSRRHLEIAGGPSGIVVRDLGSSNGLKVNGTKESEKTVNHKDEIALGETVLQVIDELKLREEEQVSRAKPRRSSASVPKSEVSPSSVPTPSEDSTSSSRTPPPSSRLSVFVKSERFLKWRKPLVAVAVLMVVLLVVVVVMARNAERRAAAQQQYALAIQEGRKLLQERKYEDAMRRFQGGRGLSDKPEIEQYLAICQRNLDASKILADAQASAALGDWDRAIEKARTVDSESDVGAEANDLIKKWTDEKRTQAVEKVKNAIGLNDFETARALIAVLPADQQEAYQRALAEQEDRWKSDAAERARAEVASAVKAKATRLRKQRQEVDEVIAPLVRKIEVGDFDGAVRRCDRMMDESKNPLVAEKVKRLKKIIPVFGKVYTEGVSRYRGGAYEEAVSPLLRALKLLEDMDLDSKLDDPLREMASWALSYQGRSSAARHDYSKAARVYKEALRLSPSSKEAKEGMAAIHAHAEEVYQEGYGMIGRDREAARRRFRDVVELVLVGDELARRAQKRLTELAE